MTQYLADRPSGYRAVRATLRDLTMPRSNFKHTDWPPVVWAAMRMQACGEPCMVEWPGGWYGLDMERDGKRLHFYKSIAETLKREEHDDA